MKVQVVVAVLCMLAVSSLAKRDEDAESAGGYDKENMVEDPCRDKHCGQGHECDIDEDNKPICVCMRQCPQETNDRAKICSSKNVTFDSECEFHRQHCLCKKKSHDKCVEPTAAHSHVDYFGPCKDLGPCSGEELEEFPERMRDWFYRVMEELSRRRDLHGYSRKLAKEAQKKRDRKWVLPVIWKFCDLDTTHDKIIDHHELFPITAPLKALEHCTQPFLEKCDEDGSGNISLGEWGKCLGLDDGEIEDRCEAIHDSLNDEDDEE